METKIPQTKQEAFAQLDEMLSEKDKNELVKGEAIEFHFSLGMWIRNNWIYEQVEEDDACYTAADDCLQRQFHHLGERTLALLGIKPLRDIE